MMVVSTAQTFPMRSQITCPFCALLGVRESETKSMNLFCSKILDTNGRSSVSPGMQGRPYVNNLFLKLMDDTIYTRLIMKYPGLDLVKLRSQLIKPLDQLVFFTSVFVHLTFNISQFSQQLLLLASAFLQCLCQ